MRNVADVTEEEIAAHLLHVATREDGMVHMSRELCAALFAAQSLSLVHRIELRRWLDSMAQKYDAIGADESDERAQFCHVAARDGRRMRDAAVRLLTDLAVASAQLHCDPAWRVETKLVRRDDGALEVR